MIVAAFAASVTLLTALRDPGPKGAEEAQGGCHAGCAHVAGIVAMPGPGSGTRSDER